MSIEVKNRFTGKTIAAGESIKQAVEQAVANGSDLSGADLSGADLSGAKLIWANLRGANLYEANLYEANLYEANLCRADLSEANFEGANFEGANFEGADLREADLRWANLSWAKLSGAKLYEANLSGANLCKVEHSFNVPRIERIHTTVYAAASPPGCLGMHEWHSCDTTHCRAGWVCVLAGDAGKALEKAIGTNAAAAMIYYASDPELKSVPNWYATNKEALADMKRLAELEGEKL